MELSQNPLRVLQRSRIELKQHQQPVHNLGNLFNRASDIGNAKDPPQAAVLKNILKGHSLGSRFPNVPSSNSTRCLLRHNSKSLSEQITKSEKASVMAMSNGVSHDNFEMKALEQEIRLLQVMTEGKYSIFGSGDSLFGGSDTLSDRHKEDATFPQVVTEPVSIKTRDISGQLQPSRLGPFKCNHPGCNAPPFETQYFLK